MSGYGGFRKRRGLSYSTSYYGRGGRSSNPLVRRADRALALTDLSRFKPIRSRVRAAAFSAATAAKETKYFDTGIAGGITWAGTTWADSEVPCDTYVTSSGTTGVYTDSALIPSANGSAYGEVAGNKYTLCALRIRGALSALSLSDQADIPQTYLARLVLVEDSQPNGAQAQGEDVLQDIDSAGENFFSFLRIPNGLGRFRIVKERLVQIPVTASGTDGTNTNSVAFQSVPFKMSIKPNCLVTIKAGNATPTVAGLINKNYFLLLAGITGAGGGAVQIIINAASRAYYKD